MFESNQALEQICGQARKVCIELVSAGDIDRDGNTGATRLGTRNRSHSALGKPLGLERAIDGTGVVRRRWSGRGGADKRSPGLLHGGNGALGGLRGGFVGVGRGGRRGLGQRASSRGVRVEDELLDGHDLLAVAELLQLAQQRLDLVNQCLAVGALELTENFLCVGLV